MIRFRNSMLCVAVFTLSSFAVAETPPTGTTAPAASETGPAATCKKLVEAAKADDYAAVAKLSLGEAKGKKGQKGFHKMHQEHAAKLKDTTCGTELLADDHAVVEAESGGKKRLIPFVKQGDEWKFDAHTYMSFYLGGKMPHGGGKPGKK